MKVVKWAFLAAVIFALAATPVLADDPHPGTLAESGYSGVTSGGGGKSRVRAGNKDMAAVSEAAPAGLNGANATAALSFYGWTNLMRLGGVGVNQSSWGCVNANEVCSQGWSSTNQNIYFIRSGNYLCRNGSCTNYAYYGVYWFHWAWAGWRWGSNEWTWWSTTSQHYFNYGSGTFTKYSSRSQVF